MEKIACTTFGILFIYLLVYRLRNRIKISKTDHDVAVVKVSLIINGEEVAYSMGQYKDSTKKHLLTRIRTMGRA